MLIGSSYSIQTDWVQEDSTQLLYGDSENRMEAGYSEDEEAFQPTLSYSLVSF